MTKERCSLRQAPTTSRAAPIPVRPFAPARNWFRYLSVPPGSFWSLLQLNAPLYIVLRKRQLNSVGKNGVDTPDSHDGFTNFNPLRFFGRIELNHGVVGLSLI